MMQGTRVVPPGEIAKTMGIAVMVGAAVTSAAVWLWPSPLERMGFGRIINCVILFGTIGAIAGAVAHRAWLARKAKADEEAA